MPENNNQRIIDLKPLTRWKRILVFLGDFFITFILGIILYTAAAYPITSAALNYDSKNNQISDLVSKSNDMLVNAGLMYYPTEESNVAKSFENSVEYTFDVFISYYLYDVETPIPNNPQLGHKIQNEVIRTYYLTYKNNPAKYLEIFNKENAKDNFFIIGETPDTIELKAEYKESLKLEFEERKDGEYSDNLVKLRDNVFARLFYLGVYIDIETNDFVIGESSYKSYLNQAELIDNTIKWSVSISSMITTVVATAIVYLVFPLIQKEHRTPTMFIMKVDKLSIFDLNYIKKRNVWLQYIFNLIYCLGGCMFYPFIIIGVTYIFNLPLVFIFSIITLVLSIGSLICCFANQYNRSGSDILSFVVLVPTSEIDKIYSTEEASEQ